MRKLCIFALAIILVACEKRSTSILYDREGKAYSVLEVCLDEKTLSKCEIQRVKELDRQQ